MAASPIRIVSTSGSNRFSVKRPPLALTPRRLEANRRNAARSTGPRTDAGKARVARNPIKHGFFVAPDRWTSKQRCDFEEIHAGLSAEFAPRSMLEKSCVASIAESYVRMAAMLRYENFAALKYHRQCESELNGRIAAADATEAAHLQAGREELRRAGLWRPTIPGPREANAIARYSGRLDRTIRAAMAGLRGFGATRGTKASNSKSQKQTHFFEENGGIFEGDSFEMSGGIRANTATRIARPSQDEERPARPPISAIDKREDAKTNPLSSMFTGNRHQRRQAQAMARRRQTKNS
jgi:hypothetical protein